MQRMLCVNVYCRLAISPNAQRKEYSAEMKGWEKYPTPLLGDYLGIEEHDGYMMKHYQFAGILEGKDRTIHILLSDTDCKKSFGYEGTKIFSEEAKPAWLIMNTHPNYPDDFLAEVKEIQKSSTHTSSTPMLGGFVTTYAELCIFDIHDSIQAGGDGTAPYWFLPINLDWQVRSKPMRWIRHVYALPLAILCLPVDVAMWVYTPIEMCFTRIEGLTYVNMIEGLKEDD